MKIIFFEIQPWEKEYIKSKLKGNLVFTSEKLTVENAAKYSSYDIVSVFIYSDVDAKVLEKLKNVKTVVTRSTGYDHIDVVECKKRGIKVYNVPSYGENTVAEHAFALILTLSKKIFTSCKRTQKGNFSCDGLEGFDLMGKTIGIVGMGNIGKHVAKIANGFGMKVVYYNRSRKKYLEKKYGMEFVSLNVLLSKSDIITLHLPYKKETANTINMKNISKIKKGAYLINTARGGLIDTTALIKALDKGILAGAGLDVLEEEENLKEEHQRFDEKYTKKEFKNLKENDILMKHENVVITPHNAFNTKEALQRILDTTIENVKGNGKGNLVKV